LRTNFLSITFRVSDEGREVNCSEYPVVVEMSDAVERVFGSDIDYAQLVKVYAASPRW
jgi:hypothetical protein